MARPSLYEEEDDLDLSSFAPKAEPAADAPPVEHVRKVTEAARFPSRQAGSDTARRKPYRRRTGRTAQFNCRITPEAFEDFYAIADKNNWTIGATVEEALEALKQKLAR
jgi:hypothetical protein